MRPDACRLAYTCATSVDQMLPASRNAKVITFGNLKWNATIQQHASQVRAVSSVARIWDSNSRSAVRNQDGNQNKYTTYADRSFPLNKALSESLTASSEGC